MINKKIRYRVRAVGADVDDEIDIPNNAIAISIHVVEEKKVPMVVTWLEETI